MQPKYLVYAVLIWLLLPLGLGTAQEREVFDRRGVIDVVALREARVIIDDTSYHLPAGTPVYDARARRTRQDAWPRVDLTRLLPGMAVGYTVAPSHRVHGQQVLTAVWMLPRAR